MTTNKLLNGIRSLTVSYPDLNRTLEIQYETQHPHGILGWTESYPEGKGMATVKATRTHVERIDYWNFKKNKDEILRKRLGLE